MDADHTPHMTATRHEFDLDSAVSDFVEQEVGKFDWASNWLKLKAESDPVERVKAWATSYGLDLDAAELVRRLDAMAEGGGAWR